MKYITNDDLQRPFYLVIEDIFTIRGRGTCITGRVQSGMLKKGDTIRIAGDNKPEIQTSAFAFEGFIRDRDTWVAQAGDNCAILLREVQTEQLERGMIVTKILADSEQPRSN